MTFSSSPLRPNKSPAKSNQSPLGDFTGSRSTAANTAYTNSAYAPPRRFDYPVQAESEAGVVNMISQSVQLDN